MSSAISHVWLDPVAAGIVESRKLLPTTEEAVITVSLHQKKPAMHPALYWVPGDDFMAVM
jgi:hypothetical protein